MAGMQKGLLNHQKMVVGEAASLVEAVSLVEAAEVEAYVVFYGQTY
jgi:hypothetical protein